MSQADNNSPSIHQLDRREVLKRGVLLGSTLLLGGNILRTAGATPQAIQKPSLGTMRFRGVNYDTGTNYDGYEGPLSRTVWKRELLARDMRAIREGLHCNTVTLYGTDIARLVEAAEVAFEHGLEVWLQPRLMGASERDRLAHLAEAAGEAEILRQHGSVTLNVGVETSLFMAGIIPGETFWEKAEVLGKTWQSDFSTYIKKLDAHLERAATLARSAFHGPLTYSAGEWERISWKPFDIVGLSFYRGSENKTSYVGTLREFQTQASKRGKPVVITEFGSCTFKGASNMGGMGWNIVDYSKAVPEIPAKYVRSEKEQADTLADLLNLYETEGLAGAFIYDFSSPGNPYSADPKYDLDMASYGLVKPILRENQREATHWEPKEAFGRVAEIYRRLERTQ